MGQFDEGFAFVDAAPIIMETGVGRVQAVFSIGGNTEPDLLYSQLTGLDAEYIVTHDLSLSPDRRYMAFRGVHPLSRQHTLQVIDLTTGSEVFSDKGDASFCNLNWVDDKTLFYGVVFNNRGCQPWRSWSQPVNEMYALDVEIDQVTRIASSDNELLNFVPSQ
jgi:protease II